MILTGEHNMKSDIKQLLEQAISQLKAQNTIPADTPVNIQIERCRDAAHGDFASNIAMTLAKAAKIAPRNLAQQLVDSLDLPSSICAVEIAGPGFINFTLSADASLSIIPTILNQKDQFGRQKQKDKKHIHLEFVSANPTGPLHVGHGRSAAYGACVANLLEAIGHQVTREYYVNDAGRQMHILALSVWIRYLQQMEEDITLPSNAYQGDYIVDIAKNLLDQKGEAYSSTQTDYLNALGNEFDPIEQKEAYIDQAILAARALIGDAAFNEVKQFSLNAILDDIRLDLQEFGVTYDQWYPESQLYEDGSFEQGIALLEQQGHVYEKEGAKWFRATQLGDEKDRVLIRDNGQPTYFASDVAYHLHSYNNYDDLIDIFGADHHGYIPRLHAFLKGLGKDPEKLSVLLVQFAVLYRGEEKVAMSTRSGEFVTLRQLRDEVGNDAARFFYIMRKPEQHLNFDLELAKSKSNENPVYYIQYAHARICSVMRKLKEQKLPYDEKSGLASLSLLDNEHEKKLINALSHYPETLLNSAQQHAPHTLARYLYDLANAFHICYNAHIVLVDDAPLRNARLTLALATQQVIINGMMLLGVSCPKEM
jgi:arginyl-tRNA synthetase